MAIDTSTDMLSCAVAWWTPRSSSMTDLRGPRSRSSPPVITCAAGGRTSSSFKRCVRPLDEAGMSMSDVGGFLVGRGPGSFTGPCASGISTAKGLARGANVPLMGTSTLDACAWTAWKAGTRGLVGVAADAMRGEVYPALYTLDDEGPHRMFERERVVKAAAAVGGVGRARRCGRVAAHRRRTGALRQAVRGGGPYGARPSSRTVVAHG